MKKSNALNILETINIPSPCTESWAQMKGNEVQRFCDLCSHNVTNLSALSQEEAARILENRTAGRLCVRYTLNQDGSIKFKPNSTKVKRSPSFIAAAAMVMSAVLGFVGLSNDSQAEDQNSQRPEIQIQPHTMGMIAMPTKIPTPEPQIEKLGELPATDERMGDIAEPMPPTNSANDVMGKFVANPKIK